MIYGALKLGATIYQGNVRSAHLPLELVVVPRQYAFACLRTIIFYSAFALVERLARVQRRALLADHAPIANAGAV